MATKSKPLDISPVTGFMDSRSTPDEVALGGYRYVKNMGVTQKNKLCRIPGWDKFLTSADYNNQDFHDQLCATCVTPNREGTSPSSASGRKPITFLFQAESTRKTIKLIVGTEDVLAVINNSTGNYKIISDQLGGENARWRAAQLLDVVVFSNNLDAPVYWNFDQGITEADDQSVATIPDLADEIKLTKAGVVVKWRSHIFLMNTVEDGTLRSSRIRWCNFENALSWVEHPDSTAGTMDLEYDETILGAEELGNRLLVYTNKAIYEGGTVANGSTGAVFTFDKRYAPTSTGENCLFYPNTLISVGDEHVYAGRDGIYVYNLFRPKPELVERWHKASNLMFDNLNTERCEVHNAAYNSDRKEIIFSYAKTGETQPSECLVFNTEHPFTSVLDHGFSAMLTYVHKGTADTVRDWLEEHCICSAEELEEDFPWTKEGEYCTEQEAVECDEAPQSIFTGTSKTIADGDDDDIVTEDYDGATADEDSLCSQLDGITLSQLCESERRVDECNSGKRFIAASTTDYCIKEFSNNYYREKCTGFTGCGTYSKLGYKSLLRSGPIAWGEYTDEKRVERLDVEAIPVESVAPAKLGLRIGVAAQARDPNDESNLGIRWFTESSKDLECPSVSSSQHETDNTRPDEAFEWPLYYEGRYIYFELEITNPAVTPVDTGGAVCFSRFTFDAGRRTYRKF